MDTQNDNAPAAQDFHIPSRAEVRRKRAKENYGVAFPLTITGGVARVRRLSLVELASNDALDAQQQAIVLHAFNDANTPRPVDEPMNWDLAVKNIKQRDALARVLCVQGFLQPRLVELQGDADAADDPMVWWVNDLHNDERIQYLNLCMGLEGADWGSLLPFPETGVARLADVPAGEADRQAPESALEDSPELRLIGSAGF